jgi:para-nitrobenzyl esterase
MNRKLFPATGAIGLLLLAACGGGGGYGGGGGGGTMYSVGGTVTGLTGSGLVLESNAGNNLPISAAGAFTFTASLASGAAYAVTVITQPSSPTQNCVVSNGSGTVGTANVTNVAVVCTTAPMYVVGGTVTGLAGSGLVLEYKRGAATISVPISGAGSFVFIRGLPSGADYALEVKTQPSSPVQQCVITNGSGRIGTASITDVAVVCADSTPTIAMTQSGAVQGVVEGNVLAFRGIPYAAPPVGNLRWRPPVAPASWQGIRSAMSFGNRCPQTDFNNGVRGNEDCLTLNVYATNPPASSKQAVMVFFHGGADRQGSAQNPPWDVAPPLAIHGVIVVTAEYRLGLLGFLANPLLTAEGQGSSGNYGLMDMIAALHWVQDNIAQFGGDPTRVMLFGQSAGSSNVQALLASPAALGLFATAGMESGAWPSSWLGSSITDAYPAYANLASLVHCDTSADVLACLRALPADTFVLSSLNTSAWFNIDPNILPENPFNKLERLGSPVPLLIGSNSDEESQAEVFSPPLDASGYATLIHTQFDRFLAGAGNAIILLYPVTDYTNPNYAHIAVESDYHYTCPTRNFARAVSGAQRPAVWRYLFTHRYETNPWVNALRAFHTAELDFVSGNLQHAPPGMPYTPDAAEIALADEIMDYWARFAARGNPNKPGAAPWSAYDASEKILQLDDTISTLAGGYRNPQCDYLSTLPLVF